MTDDIHADRRDPETPAGAFDLAGAARDLLTQAHEMSSGRAARTLTPGAGAVLKQTLLAIASGRRLDEHQANGPATVHVLQGTITVRTGDTSLEVPEGHWAAVPEAPHDVLADADAVLLLTVAIPAAARG